MQITLTQDDGTVVSQLVLHGTAIKPCAVIEEALRSAGLWDCEGCGEWFAVEPHEFELDFYCDKCIETKGDSHGSQD